MSYGLRLDPPEPQTYWEVRTLIATASDLKPADGQIQADESMSVQSVYVQC